MGENGGSLLYESAASSSTREFSPNFGPADGLEMSGTHHNFRVYGSMTAADARTGAESMPAVLGLQLRAICIFIFVFRRSLQLPWNQHGELELDAMKSLLHASTILAKFGTHDRHAPIEQCVRDHNLQCR